MHKFAIFWQREKTPRSCQPSCLHHSNQSILLYGNPVALSSEYCLDSRSPFFQTLKKSFLFFWSSLERIASPHLREQSFLVGTCLSPEDPDLLLATRPGAPLSGACRDAGRRGAQRQAGRHPPRSRRVRGSCWSPGTCPACASRPAVT